jgi:Tfp pilus assembly protein PilO
LGVGLVALSGALYLSAVAPAESRLREATDELKALQERVLQRGARADADRAGPAVELARFYSRFPSDGSLPETLRKIFRLGAQQNLRIDQAEYRVAVQGHKRLFRHDIVFPMTGTYPQIRTFLRLMSAEVPTAAPERVTFEHLNGDPRLVRAKVGLLLFTRRDL